MLSLAAGGAKTSDVFHLGAAGRTVNGHRVVLVLQVVEQLGHSLLLELDLEVDLLALEVLIHQQVLNLVAQQLELGQDLAETFQVLGVVHSVLSQDLIAQVLYIAIQFDQFAAEHNEQLLHSRVLTRLIPADDVDCARDRWEQHSHCVGETEDVSEVRVGLSVVLFFS